MTPKCRKKKRKKLRKALEGGFQGPPQARKARLKNSPKKKEGEPRKEIQENCAWPLWGKEGKHRPRPIVRGEGKSEGCVWNRRNSTVKGQDTWPSLKMRQGERGGKYKNKNESNTKGPSKKTGSPKTGTPMRFSAQKKTLDMLLQKSIPIKKQSEWKIS